MIVLSNSDIRQLLKMPDLIAVIEKVMQQVSAGDANLPLRNIVNVAGTNNLGIMPGVLGSPACYGVKLISLYPDNPKIGKSSHQGAMILFDSTDGTPIAFMDASLLTAMRTAAASAVATRILAREDAASLTLIGCGEQAEHHLEALLAVRDIRRLNIVGRVAEKAETFARWAAAHYPELEIHHGTDGETAVGNADIICSLTSAKTPVLMADWVHLGSHVNAVGASVAKFQEVETALVVRSNVFTDYLPSALAQAADIIDAIETRQINPDQDIREIGQVLSGQASGRVDDDEITLYRSLGVAAQDLPAAHLLFTRAQSQSVGQKVCLE